MVKFIDSAHAANIVRSNDCVLIGGSGGGHAVPEEIIGALGRRFLETGEPRDLTLISVVSIGDWKETGFNKLAEPGLVKRVVTGGLNNSPRFASLVKNNQIEAYTLPQGVVSQLCREMAARRPGLLTRTGLHTFIDPRQSGGSQNECSVAPLVDIIEIHGEEYLFYRSFDIDIAVIRGTTADEHGNISMEDEAFFGEMFSIATAAHVRGGTVIAQVQRVAAAGTLPGKTVKIPGAVVDYVVVDPEQRQTYRTRLNRGYTGDIRVPDSEIDALPFDVRKVMARRGAMELFPGAIVNLGFGVANGISTVAAEEGFYREITLTVEQGIIGGIPAVGMDAGAGVNFDMMVDQPYQFDFYDGGGLDIAFLSFAQVDRHGNVNVSRYADTINGPGGFINISQGARKVVFMGTLTTGGLDIAPDGANGLALKREGRTRKWVPDVDQITFSGDFARQRDQEVMFITERAVFRLGEQGLDLVEVAPGLDLRRDVLDQIGFEVNVPRTPSLMQAEIFRDDNMGLAQTFRARPRHGRRKEEQK